MTSLKIWKPHPLWTIFFILKYVSSQTDCFTGSAGVFGCGDNCYNQNTQFSWASALPSGDYILSGDTLSTALFPSISGTSYYFMSKVNSQFEPYYCVSVGYAAFSGQLESQEYLQFYSVSEDYLYYFSIFQQTGFQGVKIADGSFLQYYIVPNAQIANIYAQTLSSVYIIGTRNSNSGFFIGNFDLNQSNPGANIEQLNYMPMYVGSSYLRFTTSLIIGNYYYLQGFINLLTNGCEYPFIAKYDLSQRKISASLYFKDYDIQGSQDPNLYASKDDETNNRRYWLYGEQQGTPNGPGFMYLVQENNINQSSSSLSIYSGWTIQQDPTYQYGVYFVGGFIDIVQEQFSIALFIDTNSQSITLIGVFNFNDTGSFQKQFVVFYSAYNGFQLFFNSFQFSTLGYGILVGWIYGGQSKGFSFNSFQAFSINLPEPYYFQMNSASSYLITQMASPQSSTSYYNGSSYSTWISLSKHNNNTEHVSTLVSQKQLVTLTNRKLTIPAVSPASYIYNLGDPVLAISFGACNYNQNCLDIAYTYSVTLSNGNPFLSVSPAEDFVFSSAALQLYISTINTSYVGNYSLNYSCSVNDGFTSSSSFSLEIIYENFQAEINSQYQASNSDFPINLPPVYTSSIANFRIAAGAAAKMTLPEKFDPNGDAITVFVKPVEDSLIGYISLSSDQNSLNFNAGFKQLGDHSIYIKLTDNNTHPLSTVYWFNVTFYAIDAYQLNNTDVNQDNYSSQVVVYVSDKSEFSVNQITPTGLIVISFQKSLNLTNITLIEDEIYKSLQLSFNDQSISFTWNITALKQNSIYIQLNIQNPLLIKQGSDPSQLQINLLNPNLFFNTKTNSSATIFSYLPPQINYDDNSFLLYISQFFNNTLSSLLITQVGTQIIISQSMQMLWGLINTQQILSHSPLLTLDIPANLYYFFLLVVGTLKFDFMFSEATVSQIFNLEGNYQAYNQNFLNFGYDSSLVIQNLGFSTIIFLIAVGMIPLSETIFKLYSKFHLFKWLALILEKHFLYSFLLRFVIESYLPLFLSAFINLNFMTFISSFGETFSSLLAVVLFVRYLYPHNSVLQLLCASSPIIMGYYIRSKTIDELFVQYRFKALFQELRQNSKMGLLYYLFFMIRRIFYVISMMYFYNHQYLQLVTFMMSSFFQILYFIIYKPFETRRQNRIMILNEGLVLLYSDFLGMFTDFNYDPQLRYNIGWFILFAIFLVAIVNIVFILFDVFRNAKLFYFKLRNKFRQLRSQFSLFYKRSLEKSRSSLSMTQQTLNSTQSRFLTESAKGKSVKSLIRNADEDFKQQNINRNKNSLKQTNSSKSIKINPQISLKFSGKTLTNNEKHYKIKSKLSTVRENQDSIMVDDLKNLTEDEKQDIQIGILKRRFSKETISSITGVKLNIRAFTQRKNNSKSNVLNNNIQKTGGLTFRNQTKLSLNK